MNHFTDISQVEVKDLKKILELAKLIKSQLKNKQLAMIFEKPSTRTRTSFEVGINQLGGNAILLESNQSQLNRGETIDDTAKVLSRYVDIIMIRCFKHETLTQLAKYATVPVINGLTDYSHPCQVMADIMTFEEHKGSIENKIVAWLGDGNNMTHSWIHAAAKLNFTLNIATPKELQPKQDVLDWAKNQGAKINFFNDPEKAAKNADLVTTDTWVSMGDKDLEKRMKLLAPFQVNSNIMKKANKDAIFMHCLPAHREEEVTTEVIDGKQSVIFDEAENRLHVQKGIMVWCLL